MARLAISLAGAAIGNAIAPGIGGSIGFAIGSAVAGQIFKEDLPTQYGPKIEDGTVTSSAYGAMVPKVWGTITVAGNIIDAGELVTVSHKEESGGKGLPSQTTVTYTQYIDYCVALCDTADGIVKIFANEKLIYDATPTATVKKPTWLSFTFYDGSETQSADPTFEARRGADEVPGYRGTAYVVFKQFNVSAFGSTAINFRFVVTSNGTESTNVTVYDQVDSTQATAPNIIWNTYTDLMIGVLQRATSTENQQTIVAIDPYAKTEVWSGIIESADFGYAFWVDSVSFINTNLLGIPLYQPDQFVVVYHTSYPGGANPRLRYARFYYAETGVEYGVFSLADSQSTPVLLSVYHDHCVLYQPVVAGIGDVTLRRHQLDDSLSGNTVTVSPPDGYEWTTPLRMVACRKGWARNNDAAEMIGFVENATTGDLGIVTWQDAAPGLGSTTLTPSYSAVDEFADQNGLGQMALWDENHACWWVMLSGGSSGPVMVKVSASGVIQSETNWDTEFSIPTGNTLAFDIDQTTGLLWLVVAGVAYSWPTSDITQTPTAYDSGIRLRYDALHPPTESLFVGDAVDPTYRQYQFKALTGAGVSLQTIVEAVCDAPGTNLVTADRTAAALSGITVAGFRITRKMPRRNALQELVNTYLWDFVPRSGVLTAIVRGGSSVATLDDDDLGAHVEGAQAPPRLSIAREAEDRLPKDVGVSFIDAEQNYEVGYESTTRQASGGGTDINVEIGVVLSHDEAGQLSSILLHAAHIEAETYEGAAMPSLMSTVQPAAIITADIDGTTYPMRIDSASIVDGGVVQFRGLRHDAAIYTDYTVGGTTRDRTRSVASVGTTLLWAMDLPALRDGDHNAGIYLAATSYSPTWEGCEIFDSFDGVTYGSIGLITAISTAGFLLETLPAPAADGTDQENTLSVRLISGSLSSISSATMATERTANVAAVGDSGRWEIVRFKTVSQQADGSYAITMTHRGLRDTFAEAAQHQSGDKFVVLNQSTMSRLIVETADIGAIRYLKAVSLGRSVDQSSARTATPAGQAIKPFQPTALHAVQAGGGAWTLSWHRQDRVSSRFLQQPTMSESTETYTIDILDLGGIVLNTYAATAETYAYGTGAQAADFGGTVTFLKWRVAQVSSVVGSGDYASLTSGKLAADYDGTIQARGTLIEYWDLTDTGNVANSNSGSHDGAYAPGTYTHGAAGLVQDGSTCPSVDSAPQMSAGASSWAAIDTAKSAEVWFNADVLPSTDAEMISRQDTSGSKWWKCYLRATDAKMCLQIYDGSEVGFIVSDEAITTGQTYHLVINFDYTSGADLEMYFNARLVASGTTTGTLTLANSGTIRLGYNFGSNKFDGRWHKFAVYDTNLTPVEIYTDAAIGFGP